MNKSIRASEESKTSVHIKNAYAHILEINKFINTDSDLPFVLKSVLNYALDLSQAEGGAILLLNAKNTLEEICHGAGFEVLHGSDKMFPPGYSIHEVGTCRMGDDPKKSVLNKFNQVWDTKNLFVVDGSSFVTSGPQNPTMTILALSMRASEYVAEQLRTRALG